MQNLSVFKARSQYSLARSTAFAVEPASTITILTGWPMNSSIVFSWHTRLHLVCQVLQVAWLNSWNATLPMVNGSDGSFLIPSNRKMISYVDSCRVITEKKRLRRS